MPDEIERRVEILSRSYPKTVIASEAWQSRSWNRLENRPAIPLRPVTDSDLG